MSKRLLELHLSQLTKAWNKSKTNNYSDTNKKNYQDNLEKLFSLIKGEDFTSFTSKQIAERSDDINFIFKSLEFLDSSTLNLIPFEIVYCLDSALKDWTLGSEKLIIVTSLVKDMDNYSFDPSLATNEQLYKHIELAFNIKFESRLIQINLPASLSRDYLANVVLYHELGHFIDTKYQISRAIHDEILENLFVKRNVTLPQLDDLENYFPFIKDPDLETHYYKHNYVQILRYYIAEYFCDLFASQYINNCSSTYLQYLTQQQIKIHGDFHPSTEKRVELTNKFLSGVNDCFTLNTILNAVNKSTSGKTLSKKFEEIKSNDFLNLLPMDIENDKQLHYLFVHGWEIWLNDWSRFEKINNMQFKLDKEKVYDIVNNLIEKSIGNYVVKTNWAKAKIHAP